MTDPGGQAVHPGEARTPVRPDPSGLAEPAMLERLRAAREALVREIRKVVVAEDEALDQALVAMFAGGHCLIQGPPGTAKTLLVTSLARAMNLSFKRIQFTPDLMPSDITGTEILEEDRASGRRVAKFAKGPVFSNVVMADEINRTPPKTQAALLEVMQERQVTVGGRTYPLPRPFFVLATQSSLEREGTYPLPEAQQDRFMLAITMKYLSEDDEVAVVRGSTGPAGAAINPVLGAEELLEFARVVRGVRLPESLGRYVVDLVAASRPRSEGADKFVKEYVAWGAGLRASQNIVLGAKSCAAQEGRAEATLADVRRVTLPVLRHRIGLSFRADVDRVGVEDVVKRLLEIVPEPAA